MKQRNNILILILACCLCCALLTGCFGQNDQQYNITIDEDIEHGSIQCDVESAKAGETVTVEATADRDYQLVAITVNGEIITGNSFKMPASDVVLSATFKPAAELVENVPAGAIVINSQSAGGATAKGHITMTFGENGLTFKAFVEDASIVAKDGVAILFSQETPVLGGLLKDGKTIKVSVNALGDASVWATDASGALQATTLEGVTTAFSTWSKTGEKLDGYRVEIYVPYSTLGVTAETAKGKVTVCPVVYSAYGSLPATGTSLQGVDEDAHNTFAVLTDDNTVRDNKYNMLSAQLGSYGSVTQGSYWDLSKDYYKDDTANYPYREALLTGHDGNDNNLVFYRVSANEMYVKATLTVTGVSNKNDQWPKFGLMLFDGASKKGVYFYVDAVMSGATGNTANNITGRDLGYNIAQGDFGSWTTAKTGAFDLDSKTIVMEMVYQDGWVHMYADGQLVKTVYYGSYSEKLHFGIKSFGIDLKVTDYLASDDAEADGWANLKREVPKAQTVDILFAGDSYMDFWKGRHIGNQMSYTGATYANEGVGGTKVQYWIDKLPEMKKLYVPAKIAFHIGVNDIDDAGADPQAVLASLKTMFTKYHETFPDATIYWNSLIPNTMFASKYADYKVINAGVVEYASDKDWLVYIDQTTSFDNNGAARQDVFDDGLHLSVDIGYPIWAKNMLTAMGYDRIDGAVMGDIDGFAHTGLWEFGEGYAYTYGNWDTALWFKGVEGENVYVEATISIGALQNGDGFPKFGLLVRNDHESRWGIIDCFGYPTQKNTTAALIYRGLEDRDGFTAQSAWRWDNTAVWGSASNCNFNNVKLAIAKLGDTVYFLVNDIIHVTAKMSGEVVVGYESFNLEATITDVASSTDVDVIEKKLGLSCEDAKIDGVADEKDDIWTDEVLANTIKFGDKGDGRYFTVAAAKGSDGVYFLVNTYTYNNTRSAAEWYHNANIEFRFGNDGTQRYIYLDGAGFNAVKSSAGIPLAALKSNGNVGDIYHTTFEFYAPFEAFAGYSASDDEIALNVFGWVWDSEPFHNIMNVGTWPRLTVSEHGLRFERQISVSGANAGVSVDVQGTARHGDKVTATINVADGQALDYVKVDGVAHEVVGGKVTFTMPNKDVAIEVALKGIAVKSEVVNKTGEDYLSATVNCDIATATVGQTVPFTVTPNQVAATKATVTVNGKAVDQLNGIYMYTVDAADSAINIKVELEYRLSEAIDGVRGEGYGTPISFKVSDNRSVTVWAKTDANGVYIYAEAISNTIVTNGAEWHTNSNFEFWLNGRIKDESAYVNILGQSHLVSKSVYNYKQENGKYLNTVELYVNQGNIANEFNPDSVRLNYCFKVPGENAYMEENANLRGHSTDWWRTYHTARGTENTDLGVWSEPNCLHITKNGIVHDCDNDPAPKNATIDADFSEYQGLAALKGLGNDNAKFDFTGFVGEDGIYLAVTIYQNKVSVKDPNAWSNWSTNDNLEIYFNGIGNLDGVCAIIEDGFVSCSGGLKDYAMVRTYDETKANGYYYTTKLELYYAYNTSTLANGTIAFNVGINGDGFGGWQPLVWDSNVAYISANGIAR